MTVYYCIGTLRKKHFSIFLNFEMNKSPRRKNKIIKISIFLLFLNIFGGESVKQVQVNKFVWPNNVKALLLRLFSFKVIIKDSLCILIQTPPPPPQCPRCFTGSA